ncbi:MAG TPA: MOSC domain-containing protein [Novosphingobium sp.]|nr:MOSC domain-containing protein [Novosphingobium sp.]
MAAHVIALASDPQHRLSKQPRTSLELIEGLGVAGDAHAGVTVKHRSRVARDPAAPNLRQVHLIHAELLDELGAHGFAIAPGAMGENITTRGLDLLGLSQGTWLRLGSTAVIEVTGLRNPCDQLNTLHPGLMQAVLDSADDGSLIRKCGVMAVVVLGGTVSVKDRVQVEYCPVQHISLTPV